MIHFKYVHKSNYSIDSLTGYINDYLLPCLKSPYLNITNPNIDEPSKYYEI